MAIPGNLLSSTTEMVDPNTSGWTAKLNAVLSLGTGGRNGDGCLAVKSLASGEMQARTVSSYAVTPWTEYHAFCDASGATVPERIGIRWLNSSNAEISITWSLTAATASASWHRIAVGGEAPAGAARAQVVVSSTPAASNVVSFYENFYLGFPKTTTGNLFEFNTETSEIDATRWFAEVNSTIARQVPTIAWAVDAYTVGGHVIAMTAAANGNASMRSTDRPDAVPGVEYRAYCYLNPPTAGITTWVELRFYDSIGNQIQATRATLAQPSTGWYRQRVSAVAPANTASCSIAVGIDSATTGQVLRIDGVVVSTAPVVYAGSVVPYADASFEQGVAGWSVVSGVATIARSTPWGAYGVDGDYVGTITSATATTSVVRSAKFPLPAGAPGLNFRIRVLANATAGGWTITRAIRWYDVSNNDLGTTAGTSGAVPTPGWWSLSNDFIAPANATQAAIEYTLTATSTSSVLRIESVGLWQSLPDTSLTVHDDIASIMITMRELNVGELITVYRVTPDGTRTLVRGSTGLLNQTTITTGQMIIEDYEAPLGVPVYYYIETLVVGASTPSTRITDPVTIDVGDVQLAWLKDPGNPQRNVLLMVSKPPDWQRPIEQASHVVRGRRNKVILSGRRQGLEGDLEIWTRSGDERTTLHLLLDSGNVLLWQAAPGMGVDDMYVNVAQATEGRTGGAAQEPWRVWTLPLTEADMPVTTGVGGSGGRTWQDVLTENAAWGDLPGQYATWEDVFLDNRMG